MLPEVNNVGAATEVAARTIHKRQANEAAASETEVFRKTPAPQEAGKAYGDAAVSMSARNGSQKAEAKPGPDQVELNFALNQDEKIAFGRLFADRKDEEPDIFTQEDQELVKKAAERITRAIDEVIAKNTKTRERVEKAVSEWYSALAGGEPTPPLQFLNILRQVAMGRYDLK